MRTDTFDIKEFSAEHLYQALSNKFVSVDDVRADEIAGYLHGYLDYLKARTIVVEYEYIDKDYLEDFAAYYVRCFQPYERRCKRLHFFAAEIAREAFVDFVRGAFQKETERNFRDSYLGFIVARPLPDAIIGRTVLQTYPSDGGRRNYTCTKSYPVSLFGVELSVRSLAFQEQDTVLAACATVALWCSFQKTGELFNTPIPTPAAITNTANLVIHPSRPIPSHGLIVVQICDAIKRLDLEPEVIRVNAGVPIISLIYGYLKMGLPVIMGADIEGIGLHAITLVGYSLQQTPVLQSEVAEDSTYIPMIGLRIDAFYAHDDQIGPFSRVRVIPSATTGSDTSTFKLESSWRDDATGKNLSLYPQVLIVPVYHKIRMTFIEVQKWLTRMTALLTLALESLEWDLHLTTTNDYKKSLRANETANEKLEDLLFMPHPRFIWRAVATHQALPVLELLVDATDMERSLPIYEVVWLNEDVKSTINALLEEPDDHAVLTKILTRRFLELLQQTTKQQHI
jgi:hypothetical protein